MDAEAWQRIEEILDAALTSGRADWDRVLDERCGTDEALRPEVEALLAQADRTQGFLQAPPAMVAAALVSEVQNTARDVGDRGAATRRSGSRDRPSAIRPIQAVDPRARVRDARL